MAHPFEDKLFAFIGKPERCSSAEARDALYAVGGVTDERISTFTEYVVEFKHNGNTKKYKQAVYDNEHGYLVLLNEQQFFDVIEGKAEPPAKREIPGKVTRIPPKNAEVYEREQEKWWKEFINEKRLNNLAKYGMPTPDGGRIKMDLRSLYRAQRIKEFVLERMKEKLEEAINPNRCDNCGAPAMVYLRDDDGDTIAMLCLDCHNRLMAEVTGMYMPDAVPKRLSFRSDKGKVCEFDLEFYMFQGGQKLSATEIGKTRRKAVVFGDPEDNFDELLKKLTRRIENLLSTNYIDPDGSLIDGRAVGHIEYNQERNDYDIIIDGKPFTWEQLKKNISEHEGWGIFIQFGDAGADYDIDFEEA